MKVGTYIAASIAVDPIGLVVLLVMMYVRD
jgi:hypothetical protein